MVVVLGNHGGAGTHLLLQLLSCGALADQLGDGVVAKAI